MEDQEVNRYELEPNKELTINNKSKRYLLELTKWAKFFSILGFIVCVFIVVVSFSMNYFGSRVEEMAKFDETGQLGNVSNSWSSFGAVFGILYLLMGLLYFFPSLYLFQFAAKMKRGLLHGVEFDIEEGFKNLKSVFKFFGIFTAIILVIYLTIFLGSFLFGALVS